jgi:exopolyphosphatase/pppGpp-phosphohydrolase
MDELLPLLDQLIYSTYQQRLTMDSVPELRKKYLHLAALQIKWVIQTFNVNQVFASSAGLSDGLISAQILSEKSN